MSHELGAVVVDDGVRFSAWSAHASELVLCLFDDAGREAQWKMQPEGDGVFSVQVRGVGEGARYGLRAIGPWQPEQGHRFNPNKLLLDPYARRILGGYDHEGPVVDHAPGDRWRLCPQDDARFVPRSLVARPLPPLPSPAARAERAELIYEAHVARLTERRDDVPARDRGRFSALAAPALSRHLRQLGVTALELMPVQTRMSEPHLLRRGLRNEWGYSPVGFFALEEELAPEGEDPRGSLRQAIGALRQQGIEVWLDIVFNHTAELDLDGPVFHLRGLDHASYYRLGPDGAPLDTTGCGNSLRTEHPRVVELLTAGLRSMVTELGVSGFRFDLGVALGRVHERRLPEALRESPFLAALERDPVLSQVRRVVEPWDTRGYALGGFSPSTLEWNDRYRDGVRRFFLGDGRVRGEFATRLAGSSDVFAADRGPRASVNFVTAHDGFTLADLCSYTAKRNEANGEDNRDGHEPNHSESFGVEGPTDEPLIVQARESKQKALLLTLLMSAGTPMLAMGDELGRTQHGNNNAYCQRFPLLWPSEEPRPGSLLLFTRKLAALRASLPELQRREFFRDADITWLEPSAAKLRDWHLETAQLAALIPTERGCLWLGFNGERHSHVFVPPLGIGHVTTCLRSDEGFGPVCDPAKSLTLHARSAFAVLFSPAP